MSIKELKPKDLQALVITAAVIAGVIIIYKAGDKIADIFGKGSKSKKADNKTTEILSLQDNENPFKPEYLKELQRINPPVIHYLPVKQRNSLAVAIDYFLSKSRTVLHPLSFNSDRKNLAAVLKKKVTHKSQLSDLAGAYQKKYGGSFYQQLNSGYNDYPLLSDSTDKELFTNLISHLQNLPQ